ncbi:hypothetical protein ATY76_07430 [Rhizobium sp. R339]|nr:hypothetical protein ATY76_07430 [Rhizobium sp. R339]
MQSTFKCEATLIKRKHGDRERIVVTIRVIFLQALDKLWPTIEFFSIRTAEEFLLPAMRGSPDRILWKTLLMPDGRVTVERGVARSRGAICVYA